MSDDYKLQLSLKNGTALLNIRAQTANEFQALYKEASRVEGLEKFFPPQQVGVGLDEAISLTTQDIIGAQGREETEPIEPEVPENLLEKARRRMKEGNNG